MARTQQYAALSHNRRLKNNFTKVFIIVRIAMSNPGKKGVLYYLALVVAI